MRDEVTAHLRRNFWLGVTNGVLFMAGSSLLGPAVILPQFLSTIFESKTAIGIGSHLFMMGWALPQVAMAYFFRSLPHKRGVYIVGNATRMGLTGLFILSFFLLQENPRAVGVLFFVFLGAAALSAGLVGLAYQDIVARVIPGDIRGSYVAYRVFGGQGITALAVGFLARHILAHPQRFPYPGNYLLIFTLAWALMVSGVTAFSFVKEPHERDVRRRPRLRTYLLELAAIVRSDSNFRRYLWARGLRTCEGLAVPFYVVYARSVLGLGDEAAGTFLLAGIVATVPASILWGKLADRFGNRIVIILSSLVALAVPLAALLVALSVSLGLFGGETVTLETEGLTASAATGTVLVWLLSPVFVLISVARTGGLIGLNNYVMDTAPPRRRPLYLGFSTSMGGLLILAMPTLGGAIIDAAENVIGYAGYWVVFAAAAAAVGGAALVAKGLSEPRKLLARN